MHFIFMIYDESPSILYSHTSILLCTYDVISTLWSQLKSLGSEIYFLRGEIKKKNTLIKSFITPYTPHAEHTKQQINKEQRNTSKASSTIKPLKYCTTKLHNQRSRFIQKHRDP